MRAIAIVAVPSALLLCNLVACRGPSDSAPVAGSSSSAFAPNVIPAGPTEVRADGSGAWTGGCAEVVQALKAQLAALPSSCSKDGDCVCYGGGVSGVTGCGGASDRPTADRVGSLHRRFEAARCSHGVDCAPRRCQVTCTAGHCAER